MAHRYKFKWMILWPVYYHTPIYCEVARNKDLDFEVLFFDDIGIRPMVEKEFGNVSRSWSEVDLLKGYKYRFITNLMKHNNDKGFFNLVNPGIIRILYKERPDIVMIQGYATLSDWLAFFTARFLKIRIIFRGEATLRGNKGKSLKSKLKEVFLRWWLKQCDVVMYSCIGNKEYWKYYGVSEDKMLPIPCAVDNDFFRNEREKYIGKENDIKKELEIAEGDLVILFSARFTTRKRPLDLLKAIKSIEHSDITVLFVGDGPERKNMEKFVKENDLKAVFVGFKNQTEIPKYYSTADIDIVVSDYDPSPKAMNEAMNFELPIIVTDIVGTAYDLVKDGENGFIVNVGDIDTIAQKIDFLNKNRDIIKQMGKKSLEIVDEWTFEKDAYYVNEAINRVVYNKNKES